MLDISCEIEVKPGTGPPVPLPMDWPAGSPVGPPGVLVALVTGKGAELTLLEPVEVIVP